MNPNENSNTNSLVTCYVNVANVSPLGCGLLFRQFLGPREMSVPSFSVSFYVRNERSMVSCMGHHCNDSRITRVVAFNAVTTGGSVESATQTVTLPCGMTSQMTGTVPFNVDVGRTVSGSPSFGGVCLNSTGIRRLYSVTVRIRKVPQRSSARTTNMIVARNPIDSCIPLAIGSKRTMARCAVAILRDLKLLGVSFLKLHGLAIVHSYIHRIEGALPSFGVSGVPVSSPRMFGVLTGNSAYKMFRFRSNNVAGAVVQLIPRGVRSLVTMVSLCHPNPVSSVPACVHGHRGPGLIGCTAPGLGRVLRMACNYVICRRRIVRVFQRLTNCAFNETSVMEQTVTGGGRSILRTRHGSFVCNSRNDYVNYITGNVPRRITNGLFSSVVDFTSCTFGGSRTTTCTAISCRATCLGRRCFGRCVTTLLASILSSASGVVRCSRRYRSGNTEVLPPSIGRDRRNFMTMRNKVHFKLLTVGDLNEKMVGNVVRRHALGNGFASLCSFVAQVCNGRVGSHTVRTLVVDKTFSDFPGGHGRVLRDCSLMVGTMTSHRQRGLRKRLSFFNFSVNKDTPHRVRVPGTRRCDFSRLLRVRGRAINVCMSKRPLDRCSS